MPSTPAATRQVREWVRRALAVEAGADSADVVVEVPAGECEEADLVAAIVRHRVVEIIDATATAIGLPGRVAELVAALRRDGRSRVLMQALETARAQAVLDAAGIRSLAYKGVVLAAQSAGAYDARGPGDIDLLVGPADVAGAQRALAANGWFPRDAGALTPGTWAWRHATWSFNEFTSSSTAVSVDLHWRLDATLDGLPGFEEVWPRRTAVNVGGNRLWTLAARDAFALTCYDTSKDDWYWVRNLVDVHRLARLGGVWTGDALRPLERNSLAVTEALVGLPIEVPAQVRTQLATVPARMVRRAERAQASQSRSSVRAPGVESWRQTRHLLAASRSPRDVWHTALVVGIPAASLADVDARSAWTGVPQALLWRLRRSRRRLAPGSRATTKVAGS